MRDLGDACCLLERKRPIIVKNKEGEFHEN
jgi:hypothetical protein